jgi:limonene 1,2-monooxygenase
MRFGAFLPPHHPLGESPTRLFHRDLDLVEYLDRLGFDEFWVGEHRSAGWETIGSPELFLAAASQRTKRIMLGTGVISLPYHHPYNVAQRIVELDHISMGRAMLGVGPGALVSDAWALGIDPMTLRDRMDESLGIILRLLRETEPITYKSDWFELNNAYLQIRPFQDELPVCVATAVSPSGMKVAGKYGVGALSTASHTDEGLSALPTQWGFCETYARENDQVVSRDNWRVVTQLHLAPTREQAIAEAAEGMKRWHNEYGIEIAGLPGLRPFDDAQKLVARRNERGLGVVGTPEDAVRYIREIAELCGGFGTLLVTAHDWAPFEARMRSWELFAAHVMPELKGTLGPLRRSASMVAERKTEFHEVAGQAILASIRSHNASHPRQPRSESHPDHNPQGFGG